MEFLGGLLDGRPFFWEAAASDILVPDRSTKTIRSALADPLR
jgi:hypothetical protein